MRRIDKNAMCIRYTYGKIGNDPTYGVMDIDDVAVELGVNYNTIKAMGDKIPHLDVEGKQQYHIVDVLRTIDSKELMNEIEEYYERDQNII